MSPSSGPSRSPPLPSPVTAQGVKPTKNSAATIPNNAINAGNRTDCDIAAENGSRRNSGSCKVMVPLPAGRWGGIWALIRDVMNAAMPALPSTAPSWRTELYTAELAPARCGGRLRVAVAVSGDHTNAIPTPTAKNGSASRQIGVSGDISKESQVSAVASTEKPRPSTGRGWYLSTIRPTNGANTPLATAIGAINRAERVGDNPQTACA